MPLSNFATSNTQRISSHLDGVSESETISKRPRIEHELVHNYIHSKRKMLQELVDIVLDGRPIPTSFYLMNSAVESLCKLKYEEQSKLSGVISTKLDNYMREKVVPLLQNPQDNIASVFIEQFQLWESRLRLLNQLFLYLDTNYLWNSKRKRIHVQGLDIFRENLLFDQPTCTPIYTAFFSLLESNRESHENSQTAQSFTKILVALDYDNKLKLHNRLIDKVVAHCKLLSKSYVPQEYFEAAFTAISREVEFFRVCGKSDKFLRELLCKLQWSLVFEDFGSLLSLTMQNLAGKPLVLKTLYGVCKMANQNFQYDAVSALKREWSLYIQRVLSDIFSNPPAQVVPVLVHELNNCRHTVQQCYENDSNFEFCIRDTFAKALNEKERNTIVLSHLCKYCDTYFKKQEGSFEDLLENVLTVYNVINSKADFLTLYKKDLSRRILLGKSDIANERKLAEKLMEIIGQCELNDGIQVMFHDIELSASYSFVSSDTFHPLVLTKSQWPDIPKMYTDEVVLPAEFANLLGEFTAKYHEIGERNKNQSLDWTNYSLHTITLMVEFNSGVKELSLNLFQATILLLFQETDSMTIEQIAEASKIRAPFLQKILSSLEKNKIILKEDNVYTFNANFSDKASKIKVPFVQKVKSAVVLDKDIVKNRQDADRAALVRICKKHGRISISNLLKEATKVLSALGPSSVRDLKLAIDYLIEHEFIRRVDSETVEYQA